MATAATGGVMMLTTLLVFSVYRRGRQRRKELKLDAARSREDAPDFRRLTIELDETRMELEREQQARKSMEEQMRRMRADQEKRMQEQNTELARTCAALQKELDERRQAERTLVVQRQELARSKDVLELHVQARTQEIQKLKGRYEQVLNSAGDGIYGLDLQGRTTFVNPAAARLTGWDVEELVNKPESEIFQYRSPDESAPGQTEVMPSQEGLLTEVTFRRRDGSTFPVDYNRTPIMENGRLVGAVIIFRDITERKRAEESLARKAEELARSNGELEQFAYVASHDLQEPLRKIQAFGDRLKAKVEAVHLNDGRDYLDRMQNAAARMQNLIGDLLTFSRVISSSQPFVPVSLATITREVLTDMEVSVERAKAQVEVGDLPTVDADPTQMRQLLQNLISNSIKFQPPGQAPLIQVSAQILKRPFSCVKHPTPDDEVCELRVKDNGIGFDEQYLEKVFAVFQRLHGRSEYEGTGVGLAVCRRIMDRHGGTITAQSKPGEGATFIVTLPLRQPNPDKPPCPNPPSPS